MAYHPESSAALAVIVEAMRADFETQLNGQDRNQILLPYVHEGNLPAHWIQRRIDGFQRQVQLQSVDAAAHAAQRLGASYVALVENPLDETGITGLPLNINGIVAVIESVGGSP